MKLSTLVSLTSFLSINMLKIVHTCRLIVRNMIKIATSNMVRDYV